MRIATLALFVRDYRKVLLGEKKSGAEMGSGMLNGAGGKQEQGESLYECLVRETFEEFGVTIIVARKVAILLCSAGGKLHQIVHVYLVTEWTGEPVETDAMFLPRWYAIDDLPTERMHEADARWMPQALQADDSDDARFNARIFYREPGRGFEGIEFDPFDDSLNT